MLLSTRIYSNIISNRTTSSRHNTTNRATSHRSRTQFRTRSITHNRFTRRTSTVPSQPGPFRRGTQTNTQHFQARRHNKHLPRFLRTHMSNNNRRTSRRRHSTRQTMRPIMFRPRAKRRVRTLRCSRRRHQGTGRTNSRTRTTTSRTNRRHRRRMTQHSHRPPMTRPRMHTSRQTILFSRTHRNNRTRRRNRRRRRGQRHITRQLSKIRIKFRHTRPTRQLPILRVPTRLQGTNFRLIFLNFRHLFNAYLLLIRLQLHLIRLLLNLHRFKADNSSNFARYFAHNFIGLKNDYAYNHRHAYIHTIYHDSHDYHTHLRTSGLISLLIRLLPVHISLQLHIHRLLINLHAHISSLLITHIRRFLPANLLTINFRNTISTINRLLSNIFMQFIRHTFNNHTLSRRHNKHMRNTNRTVKQHRRHMINNNNKARQNRNKMTIQVTRILQVRRRTRSNRLNQRTQHLIHTIHFVHTIHAIHVKDVKDVKKDQFKNCNRTTTSVLTQVTGGFSNCHSFTNFFQRTPFLRM